MMGMIRLGHRGLQTIQTRDYRSVLRAGYVPAKKERRINKGVFASSSRDGSLCATSSSVTLGVWPGAVDGDDDERVVVVVVVVDQETS